MYPCLGRLRSPCRQGRCRQHQRRGRTRLPSIMKFWPEAPAAAREPASARNRLDLVLGLCHVRGSVSRRRGNADRPPQSSRAAVNTVGGFNCRFLRVDPSNRARSSGLANTESGLSCRTSSRRAESLTGGWWNGDAERGGFPGGPRRRMSSPLPSGSIQVENDPVRDRRQPGQAFEPAYGRTMTLQPRRERFFSIAAGAGEIILDQQDFFRRSDGRDLERPGSFGASFGERMREEERESGFPAGARCPLIMSPPKLSGESPRDGESQAEAFFRNLVHDCEG